MNATPPDAPNQNNDATPKKRSPLKIALLIVWLVIVVTWFYFITTWATTPN